MKRQRIMPMASFNNATLPLRHRQRSLFVPFLSVCGHYLWIWVCRIFRELQTAFRCWKVSQVCPRVRFGRIRACGVLLSMCVFLDDASIRGGHQQGDISIRRPPRKPERLIANMPNLGQPHTYRGATGPHFGLICGISLIFIARGWTPSTALFLRGHCHLSPPRRTVTCLHSVSDTDAETQVESFTSPVMKVYIEDTDAYGMKYNGNYVRSYERTLHAAQGVVGTNSIIAQHVDWTLTKVTNQKFKSTASLGGDFIVQGTLVQRKDSSEEWDLTMVCPETNAVYNSATVTVGLPLGYSDVTPALNVESAADNSLVATKAVHHDTLHRDEFDAHHPHHLPLRSVLNLCERARSNYIGGPDALSRLHQDENVLVVVTGINDLCSFEHHSYPRQRVRVESTFVPKRRGMVCECRHFIYDDENNDPIAQAFVTMVALNATNKRPTTDLPDGLW